MSKNPRIQVYFSKQDYEYLSKVKAESGESNSQIIKRILHYYQNQESIVTNHYVIPGECCKECTGKYTYACTKCDKVYHKFEHVTK